jgi:hypothetical protein
MVRFLSISVCNRQKSCGISIAKSGPIPDAKCICQEMVIKNRAARQRNAQAAYVLDTQWPPEGDSEISEETPKIRRVVSPQHAARLFQFSVIALIYRSFCFHARSNWSWHGFCERSVN